MIFGNDYMKDSLAESIQMQFLNTVWVGESYYSTTLVGNLPHNNTNIEHHAAVVL